MSIIINFILHGFTFTGGTALARDLNRVFTGDRWTQSCGTSHHAILK